MSNLARIVFVSTPLLLFSVPAWADGGPFNHCSCSTPGIAGHISVGLAMAGAGGFALLVARRRRAVKP
jgi:hypothetical protein